MPLRSSNKPYIQFRNWITGSWGVFIGILFTSIGVIFMMGYWVGSFVTKDEENNVIMNLKFDHQKEIVEEREKAKVEVTQEIKSKNDEIELIYKRVKEELRNEKRK